MPDLACAYTLTTPGGTIVFNDGAADQYYIQDIPQGLSQAPVRATEDDLPFGDGGLSYHFWTGARHILIEGVFLVTSVDCGPLMNAQWNTMEDALIAALDSIAHASSDTGTLAWTPTGSMTQRELVVRSEVALECPPDQNYLLRAFHFGLLADNPDWTGN